MSAEPGRARDGICRRARVGIVLLALSAGSVTGPLVVGVAAAAPSTDLDRPAEDVEAPTSAPEPADPSATEPPATDEPATTVVDEIGADDGTTADEDDGVDAADAITWIALVAAVALLGTAAWWMSRRPEEDRLPPSDADWPTDAEIP